MRVVGSSKQISNREIFYLVVLFQQSGIFWLLPYFLVRENGTIGLFAISFGILVAMIILWVSRYWCMRMPKCGFITALQQQKKSIGSMLGSLFCLFYLLFAICMVYSLLDVIQHQLFRETPYVVLCAITVLFVGWMSWSGLESIARMSVFGVGLLCLMIVLSIVGSADLFSFENALPVQIKNPMQLQEAALQSAFCYSGLLLLFMIYPSSNHLQAIQKSLWMAVGIGALLFVAWSWYALCILGEYSLQNIFWIPIQLARMVQISSVTEQTESLFIVLWMGIVLCNSSLFLWGTAEGVHQLCHKQKNKWLYSIVTGLLFFCLLFLQNRIIFLQMLSYLAHSYVFLIPLMLLGVLWLAPKRRR